MGPRDPRYRFWSRGSAYLAGSPSWVHELGPQGESTSWVHEAHATDFEAARSTYLAGSTSWVHELGPRGATSLDARKTDLLIPELSTIPDGWVHELGPQVGSTSWVHELGPRDSRYRFRSQAGSTYLAGSTSWVHEFGPRGGSTSWESAGVHLPDELGSASTSWVHEESTRWAHRNEVHKTHGTILVHELGPRDWVHGSTSLVHAVESTTSWVHELGPRDSRATDFGAVGGPLGTGRAGLPRAGSTSWVHELGPRAAGPRDSRYRFWSRAIPLAGSTSWVHELGVHEADVHELGAEQPINGST